MNQWWFINWSEAQYADYYEIVFDSYFVGTSSDTSDTLYVDSYMAPGWVNVRGVGYGWGDWSYNPLYVDIVCS